MEFKEIINNYERKFEQKFKQKLIEDKKNKIIFEIILNNNKFNLNDIITNKLYYSNYKSNIKLFNDEDKNEIECFIIYNKDIKTYSLKVINIIKQPKQMEQKQQQRQMEQKQQKKLIENINFEKIKNNFSSMPTIIPNGKYKIKLIKKNTKLSITEYYYSIIPIDKITYYKWCIYKLKEK